MADRGIEMGETRCGDNLHVLCDVDYGEFEQFDVYFGANASLVREKEPHNAVKVPVPKRGSTFTNLDLKGLIMGIGSGDSHIGTITRPHWASMPLAAPDIEPPMLDRNVLSSRTSEPATVPEVPARYTPHAKGIKGASKPFRAPSGCFYLWEFRGNEETVTHEKGAIYSVKRKRATPLEGWRLFDGGAEVLQLALGIQFKGIIRALDILNTRSLAGIPLRTEMDVYSFLTKNGW